LIAAERLSSSASACIWRARSPTSVAIAVPCATSSTYRFSCSKTAASENCVASIRCSAAAISFL